VVVKGDRIVTIRDPKTKKSYAPDRTDLTLPDADGDGLQVTLDGDKPVVLRRNGKKIATLWLNPNPGVAPVAPSVGESLPPPATQVALPPEWLLPLANAQTRFPLFSPNGSELLVPDGNTVAVWNLATREKVQTLAGPLDRVMAVQLTPDGKTVIALANDRCVFGWDRATGRKVAEFAVPDCLDPITLTVFRDGKRVAVPGPPGTVSVRAWPSGEQLTIIDLGNRDEYMCTVAASPDGKWVGVASSEGRAWLWDMASGRVRKSFPAVRSPVRGFSVCGFSPDGRLFAVGAVGGLRVWKTDDPDAAPTAVDTNASGLVAFSRDGSRITTTSVQPTARVTAVAQWDARTGRAAGHYPFRLQQLSNHCGIAPDGHTVAVHDEQKRGFVVLDLSPPSGPHLVERHRQKLPLLTNGLDTHAYATAFSPDGSMYAVGGDDNLIHVWDARTGALRHTLRGHTFWISGIAFAGNSQLISTCDTDKSVRLWDLADGTELRRWDTSNGVGHVHVSGDGRRAVFGGGDGTARVWDVGEWREVRCLRPGRACSATISADGREVVTYCGDKIQRWAVDSGAVLAETTGSTGVTFQCQHATDGRVLVVAHPGGVSVRDPLTLKEVRRSPEKWPRDWGYNWGVSPDGRFLVTADEYGSSARLWDMDTWLELRGITLPSRPSGRMAFSPDGKHLACGSLRGYAYLLRLELPPAVAPHPRVKSVPAG
jgi:WD40 repeat protein